MPNLTDVGAASVQAPDTFTAELNTTCGVIHIDVERALAPRGADRFYSLVRAGYYDGCAFFRVVPGFVAQVGISPDPRVNKVWRDAPIQDDPVVGNNDAGTVTFATSGPNARTTQFFINFRENRRLDAMGFAPFGRVRDMAVVGKIHDGYGEGAPRGRGPQQGRIHREGEAYLKAEFPDLDVIIEATIVEG